MSPRCQAGLRSEPCCGEDVIRDDKALGCAAGGQGCEAEDFIIIIEHKRSRYWVKTLTRGRTRWLLHTEDIADASIESVSMHNYYY